MMMRRDLVVIGASAGGVDALTRLLGGLPRDMPASLFLVLHTPPKSTSALPAILSGAGGLVVRHAVDGEEIRPGRVYAAPPDQHLVVTPHRVRLWQGPHENRSRPSIDVLFRTAAEAYGPRVIAVVLSGAMHDGTAGLLRVKARGGLAVLQAPDGAMFPAMALTALKHVDVDYVMPVSDIPALLVCLAGAQASRENRDDWAEFQGKALRAGEEESSLNGAPDPDGSAARLVCPECGGSSWENFDGGLIHYHRHVGYVCSAEYLRVEPADIVERSLQTAWRALQQRTAILTRLAERERHHGNQARAERLETRARTFNDQARLVCETIATVVASPVSSRT